MLAVKKITKKERKNALSSGPRTCARLASGRLFLWQHEHRSKTSSWMYWSSSRGPSVMAWVMPFYDIFVRNYRVKQDTWQIGHMPWPPMQNRRGFWKEKKSGKMRERTTLPPTPQDMGYNKLITFKFVPSLSWSFSRNWVDDDGQQMSSRGAKKCVWGRMGWSFFFNLKPPPQPRHKEPLPLWVLFPGLGAKKPF